MKAKCVSIVIPAYNEEKTIGILLERVIAANSLQLTKEIIVVDDCSTDETVKEIEVVFQNNRANKHETSLFLNKVHLENNVGKTRAIVEGIVRSTGDIVIIQDADLEYDPQDYALLISPFLEQDADVVYGSRFMGNEPKRILYFWHTVGNKLLTILSNMCSNLNLTDMETGYKAFRGDIIRKLSLHINSTRFGFEPEITARIAKISDIRIFEVGIRYWGRTYKEGKKIGWKDGLLALGQVIRYNFFTKNVFSHEDPQPEN